MDAGPMVHLRSVADTFHARVIAARLGSDGIVTELRGAVDGPYPGLGEVRIYVAAEDLAVARELLLADEVESAFEDPDDLDAPGRRRVLPAWLAVAVLVAVAAAWLARAY
ncbi:MAG TPA: DUF2007 domain-containing protein [Acidimicrobiales bacterium]|nr:DUF2007 domain-containing protein [Acidimicrobiales bacterium]